MKFMSVLVQPSATSGTLSKEQTKVVHRGELLFGRPMKNATLADIAREASVAISTASIVLSKGAQYDEIPEATRERINAAARKLKYLPYMGSRQLKRQRSGTIALLLSAEPHRSSMHTDLLYGIAGQLLPRDLGLSFVRLDDKSLAGTVPRFLRQKEVDGVLVNYNVDIPPQLIELIHHYEIPSVFVNTRHAENLVYFDHYGAARRVIERLLSLGHRRVLLLNFSGPFDHYSVYDSVSGYRDAMQQAGLEPWVLDTPVSRADRMKACLNLLAPEAAGKKGKRGRVQEAPTAIFTLHMSSALPVIQAAEVLGLALPQKLSLCTIGDEDLTSLANPQPGHIILPWMEMARVSVQMLLNRIEGKIDPLLSGQVSCEWADGAGTIGVVGQVE